MTEYENFERIIKERGITPYRIAKETGLTTVLFTDWKSGKSKPKYDKLKKIADFLGITVDYLLGKEESPKSSPVDLSSLLTPQEEALIRIFEGTTEDGRLKMIQALMNISAEEKEKKPRSDVG